MNLDNNRFSDSPDQTSPRSLSKKSGKRPHHSKIHHAGTNEISDDFLEAYKALLERKQSVEEEHTLFRKNFELLQHLYSCLLDSYNERTVLINSFSLMLKTIQKSIIARSDEEQKAYAKKKAERDKILDEAARILQAEFNESLSDARLSDSKNSLQEISNDILSRYAMNSQDRHDALLIRKSPLFDEKWYIKHYPAAKAEKFPAAHYLKLGWLLGYDPSPWFSTSAYLDLYPDVNGNPLLDYLTGGQEQKRTVVERRFVSARKYALDSGFFDPEWYIREHPEVAGHDPWIHFVCEGWLKDFDPSPKFSMKTYCQLNPDVRGAGNPFLHFLFFGFAEHREFQTAEQKDVELLKSTSLFDEKWYLKTYPDLVNADMDLAVHYLKWGYKEGRDPSAFFHTRDYFKLNPDVPLTQNPLLHFLRSGCSEKRQFLNDLPHQDPVDFVLAEKTGLFDEKYYMLHNRDLAGMPMRPIEHFMNFGWKEGREPSGQFSVRDYNNFNPDIKAAHVQPMSHFITAGIIEGRKYAVQITEMNKIQTYRQMAIVPKLYDPEQPETIPFSGKRTIAVHLHLYYTEMADYFVHYLAMIPQEFDLFVSLPANTKTDYYRDYFKKELPYVKRVEVVHTPNRGRDIAPFIVTFGKKLMKYDWICHIHSKRSPHAAHQLAGWLDYLMQHLFGSTEQLKFIFSLLEQNDRIVFPPAYSQLDYDDTGWGRNYQLMQSYISTHPMLNLKALPPFIEFSHGSMLWARGSAMAGFLDLPLTYEDFPEEPISSDSTLAHVLERLELLKTASCGDNADMLFLKNDIDDHIRYLQLKKKFDNFSNLLDNRSTTSKKLLLVSHDSDKSGGPILALNIARTLNSMGYKLYIIILKNGELFKEFQECGTVKLVPFAEFDKFQASLPILLEAGFRNVLLNTLLSGSLAPIFHDAGFNVITLVHEMGFSIKEYHWEQHCHQVFLGSDKVVMPSSVVAQSWRDIGLSIASDKLIINPQADYWSKKKNFQWNRLEAHRKLCNELQIPEDSKIVLSAAVVEKRKGIDAFIETAEIFLEKDPDVYFVWVGATQDKMAEIPGLTEKAAKLTNCIFTGFKTDLDMFMAGADIFFLPSLADPFPAVTLLAASQGTPPVLCDGCTGSADFCKKFSAGLVKNYSAADFAAEIRRLLSRPEFHAKVSREVLDFSSNFHSMRQYLIDLLSYYPDGLKKVSCIVPNYQYEKYLPERLNSIIKQDYPIYDIVFLDDCSNDNSLKVAEKILSAQNIDYVILTNKLNSGNVFRQWFKGIKAAKGDFIWIAEADDSCSPEFLRKTVSGFKDPQVNLSYSQSCLIDSAGKVFNENYKTHTDSISSVKWTQNFISPMGFEINDGLAVKNTIPNASAIVIRKSAVSKINKKNLFSYQVAGDWMFYLELLQNGRVAFTPEILNYYRRHTVSVVSRNMTRNYQEIEMIHRYILENFEVNNATILAMEKEFYHNFNAAKPDFKPALDYRKYLKARKADTFLIFLTDDLGNGSLCSRENLESLAADWEIRLIYAGKNNPKAQLLEQIPVSIGFTRLSDFRGSKRPDVKRIVIAADLSEDILAEEFSSLKMFLASNDALLIQDRDSYFSSRPNVFYQRGSLKDKLISILNSEKVSGEQIFYFRTPNEHIKSK
jgi:glycosyltransferase involved in cell wall biosynthesis